MENAIFTLQAAWLITSGANLLSVLTLRRANLKLARDKRVTRHFKQQAGAWEGVGVEIASAIIRGTAGFFLPPTLPVLVLLSIGLSGRIYQLVRLWNANTAITNGAQADTQV